MKSFVPSTGCLASASPETLHRLRLAVRGELAKQAGPLAWNAHFLPAYFTDPPATLHEWLDRYLADLHARRGSKVAVLAPREAAKSTWVTLAYVLRCLLDGREPYVLVLCDSGDQATKHLQDLRAELESNPQLAAAYPEACGPGAGEWRADRVRLRNGALVEALGRGAKVRGRRNRSARPSLVVLDDVQSNRDIVSEIERRRAWDWFVREVIPAGSAATNFISVGTAIHREAVAVRAGSLPGWSLKKFPAVLSWPARGDLWLEWEQLATNLTDERRVETAERYHAANRSAMDAGAVTFWPSRKPIAALMAKRAEIGSNAFATEFQGDPTSPDGAEFPAEYFDRAGLWFDDWPAGDDLRLRVQSLDPSKGSNAKTGDYQAHVLVGVVRGGVMLVEAVLGREPIGRMVDRTIDLPRLTGFGPPDAIVVEANDSLGMLKMEFERRAAERRLTLPLEHITNTKPKLVRVRRLGIYLGRNRIRFRNTPGTRLLVEQLREFPLADHDDGPDALELAIRRLELSTHTPLPGKK